MLKLNDYFYLLKRHSSIFVLRNNPLTKETCLVYSRSFSLRNYGEIKLTSKESISRTNQLSTSLLFSMVLLNYISPH